MTHGTRYGYRTCKCRCPECIEWNRAQCETARVRRVARAQQTGIPAGVTHGYATYNNWGCRCDVCRDDVSRYNRLTGRRSA